MKNEPKPREYQNLWDFVAAYAAAAVAHEIEHGRAPGRTEYDARQFAVTLWNYAHA